MGQVLHKVRQVLQSETVVTDRYTHSIIQITSVILSRNIWSNGNTKSLERKLSQPKKNQIPIFTRNIIGLLSLLFLYYSGDVHNLTVEDRTIKITCISVITERNIFHDRVNSFIWFAVCRSMSICGTRS